MLQLVKPTVTSEITSRVQNDLDSRVSTMVTCLGQNESVTVNLSSDEAAYLKTEAAPFMVVTKLNDPEAPPLSPANSDTEPLSFAIRLGEDILWTFQGNPGFNN
jgi:hypothetical protein